MAAIIRVLNRLFPKNAKFPRSATIRGDDVHALFTLGNVPGDGNCLFHSVAIQLNTDFNSNIHLLIREDVCKYYNIIISNPQYITYAVANNPDMFSCATLMDYLLCTINTMIPDDTNVVDPKYINICKNGEYGDQDDITAIALIYNIRIIVCLPDYGGHTYTMLDINPDPLKNLHTIFLYCNNAGGNGGHYQPMLLTEQSNSSYNKFESNILESSKQVKFKLQNGFNKPKIFTENIVETQKQKQQHRENKLQKQLQAEHAQQAEQRHQRHQAQQRQQAEQRHQEQADYEYAKNLQKEQQLEQEEADYEYARKLQKELQAEQEQEDYEYAIRLHKELNQIGGIIRKRARFISRRTKLHNALPHIATRRTRPNKRYAHTHRHKPVPFSSRVSRKY